jgi:hypothetical protein
VWAAFGAIVLGIVIIAVQHHRHPGAEPGVYRRGYEWTPDADDVDSKNSDPEEQTDGDAAAAESEPDSATATSPSRP